MMLWARFAPGQATRRPTDLRLALPGTLDELADPERATAHAVELRRALCPEPIDLSDKTSCGSAEHVSRRAMWARSPSRRGLAGCST